jgi:hypothetical protein
MSLPAGRRWEETCFLLIAFSLMAVKAPPEEYQGVFIEVVKFTS